MVEKFTVVDPKTGKRQVFNSLQEVPPEIRAMLEDARAQGKQGSQDSSFTFRGPDGQERTYRSLEEMPPNVRALYEQVVLPELRAQGIGIPGEKKPPPGPPADEDRTR